MQQDWKKLKGSVGGGGKNKVFFVSYLGVAGIYKTLLNGNGDSQNVERVFKRF